MSRTMSSTNAPLAQSPTAETVRQAPPPVWPVPLVTFCSPTHPPPAAFSPALISTLPPKSTSPHLQIHPSASPAILNLPTVSIASIQQLLSKLSVSLVPMVTSCYKMAPAPMHAPMGFMSLKVNSAYRVVLFVLSAPATLSVRHVPTLTVSILADVSRHVPQHSTTTLALVRSAQPTADHASLPLNAPNASLHLPLTAQASAHNASQVTSSPQQHHPAKSATTTALNVKPVKPHAPNAHNHFSCTTTNVSAHVPMAFMAIWFQQLMYAKHVTAWLPIAVHVSLAVASNVKIHSTCSQSLAPTLTHAFQPVSQVFTPTLPT